MTPPGSTYTRDELFAELDALGEEKVRERLAASFYGDGGTKLLLVQEWLRSREEAARSAAAAKDRSLAASANAIAARQTQIAEMALKIAAISAVISAMSFIVSVVSIIRTFR